MFGLKTPLARDQGNIDFDTINTILCHSVYNSPTPIQLENNSESVPEKEDIFYLKLFSTPISRTDSFTCNGHTTDDTGYGTDNDETASCGGSWEKSCQTQSDLNSSFFPYTYRNSFNSLGSFNSGNNCCLDDSFYYVDFSRMDNIVKVVLQVKRMNLHQIDQNDKERKVGHLGRILCKELIGIIPGHFPGQSKGHAANGQRLCVRGLVPHSHAAKYSNIHKGDCLRLINGREVKWDNIDDIFLAISNSQEVSVVIQKATVKEPQSSTLPKPRSASNEQELVHLVRGVPPSEEDEQQESPSSAEHCFMVIDLNKLSEEQVNDEDLIFCHPCNMSTALPNMRGALLTLYQSMPDVSHSKVQRSCLVHDGKTFNVSYYKEDHILLLLIFPQSVICRQSLLCVMGDLLRLIRVLHGSVLDAFTETINHSELFSMMSLWQHSHCKHSLSTKVKFKKENTESLYSFGRVRYLPLDSDVNDCIEGYLNSWESLDFTNVRSLYGSRRMYTSLGTCLFYKSSLLCSHLPKEDLLDLYLYVKHQLLLQLSKEDSIDQLVIWRSINSTRQTYDLGEEQMFGYTEPVDAKLYWLIVGHKHCILCTLFESRGGALKASKKMKPDSLFIDQARATLIQINALGLHKVCRQRNNVDRSVCSIDTTAKPSQPSAKISSFPVTSSPKLDIASIIQRKRLINQTSRRKDSIQSDESMDSNSSAGSTNMSGVKKKLFLENGTEKFNTEVLNSKNIKLTTGEDNCLLYFLHIDKFDGMLISPEGSKIKEDVLNNFHKCCTHIKHMFDKYRYRKKSSCLSESVGGSQLPVRQDLTFINIREEGVMFTAARESESGLQTLDSYWVVGRQRTKEEIYVCFRDGTAQSVIELAFRSGFGIKC